MVFAVCMSGGGRMRVLCVVVRLYSVVEIVVMSGEVACYSVVCGTLVGVSCLL